MRRTRKRKHKPPRPFCSQSKIKTAFSQVGNGTGGVLEWRAGICGVNATRVEQTRAVEYPTTAVWETNFIVEGFRDWRLGRWYYALEELQKDLVLFGATFASAELLAFPLAFRVFASFVVVQNRG